MADVEIMALWISIIVGITGVVLSIVAIAFAYLVNKRSGEIGDQTIRSLQKIELRVDGVSEDTRSLIKAAWDKLLGVVEMGRTAGGTETTAKEISAGIVAELRADLGLEVRDHERAATDGDPEAERRNRSLETLESTLAAQIITRERLRLPGEFRQVVAEILNGLSGYAQILAQALQSHHLGRDEYVELTEGPLGYYLRELRENGLLVPLQGRDHEGKSISCYWFPPGIEGPLRSALQLLPDQPKDIQDMVQNELKRVGYPKS